MNDPRRRAEHRALALSVLVPGMNGTTVPTWLRTAIADGLAGVLLFAPNTPDLETTRALSAELHAAGPVLVMADEESGDVSRLQAAGGSSLAGAAALGAADDVELARESGRMLGRLQRAVGIDMDLAPVLDVASEPHNPVIGVRSFGPSAEVVSRHGAAMVQGLAEGGVLTCGKHFPGHGDTLVDSHLSLPTLDIPVDTLRERDLPPFAAAAAAGMDSVMTGHLLIPALGSRPGTLEPAVTALVRELPGGEDLAIITDALDMGAVSAAGLGEVCVQALEAGADLLCLGHTMGRDDEAQFELAVAGIVQALDAGRLSPEQLAEPQRRIARLRERAAAHREQAPREDLQEIVTELEQLGARAARAAVIARGAVQRTGQPVLLDVRRRVNQAAGRFTRSFELAVQSRDEQALIGPDLDLAELPEGAAVMVVCRAPVTDAEEGERLRAVLAARPDAVVIHTGTRDSAPAHDALVLTSGAGRANAEAAIALILDGPREEGAA